MGAQKKGFHGNLNVSFENVNAGDLLLDLDKYGICASSASACSSNEAKVSHVLTAIGLTENLSRSTLRITFGNENTKEDVDYLIEFLVESVKTLKRIS